MTEWLVVHHQRPGSYDKCTLEVDAIEVPFLGEDAFGRFAWVRAAALVTIRILVGGTPEGPERTVNPLKTPQIWTYAGDPATHVDAPATPGPDDAVIHYRRPDGDYAGWGLHAWEGAATPAAWDAPLAADEFDTFGAVFRVPLREDAAGLRFMLHRGDEKESADDQRIDFGRTREIWVLAGETAPLVPSVPTLGPEFDPARALAVFVDRTTIALPSSFAALASEFSLVSGEDTVFSMTPRPNGLFQAQSRKFPHLRAYKAFSVREMGDAALGFFLRGQLTVTGRDAAGRLSAITGVQLAGVIDDLYADAADADLGPRLDDERPQLALWAPTARTVELELFRDPADEPKVLPMERDAVTGVWSIAGKRKWLGRYYRYRVEVWHPAAQRVVTSSVSDPYSLALSVDSTHSLLVDLADPTLKPPGWEELAKPAAAPAARMQIAEVSIRDFSIADASVPPALRGTYGAFDQQQSDGMRHLLSLAEAGLTHLHLLPAADFASVPDRRADQAVPACDLASFPPDSPEQQRIIAEIADNDGYNWGYDPWHWTTPEGSYAAEPDGTARILEFRRMVAALNAAGLRVIMDVVYNHTAADGLAPHSVLDRVVPGYYHRLAADGSTENSTCCANTAPENMMMGRLVVDSLVTWAREYKVDGFRFDLMGHHPRANILEARVTLDHLDGGRDIVLYGEGWNFGEVAGDARFVQATQVNMAGTGVATFNDRLRDAVRGGGALDHDPSPQGFVTGAPTLALHDALKVGLSGGLATYRFVTSTGAERSGAQIDYDGSPSGYTAAPGESISYVDAHDNEILWDALAYKLPLIGAEERARRQVLALSLVVLGQGAGFLALGSERLRSKSLDRNSYNSGDWFNQIRWNPADGNGFGLGLPPAADNEHRWEWARPLLADPALIPSAELIELAAARFRELLRVRRSTPVFGLPTADEVQRRLSFPLGGPAEEPGVLVMALDGTGLDPQWRQVVTVFNATTSAATAELPPVGACSLHPELLASADSLMRTAEAKTTPAALHLTVPALTTAVFVVPHDQT